MKPTIEQIRGDDPFYARVLVSIMETVNRTLEVRDSCHIALSGGRTPVPLFAPLARAILAEGLKDRLHFWWVDERAVPESDYLSNYGTARELLLDPLAIESRQIHPIRYGENLAEMVRLYEEELREWAPMHHHLPSFDLILLGMGGDGHTASLFPGQESFWTPESWVLGVPEPETAEPKVPRVTLGPKVLENGRSVMLITKRTGREKILDDLLDSGTPDLMPYPAVRLSPESGWTWFVELS